MCWRCRSHDKRLTNAMGRIEKFIRNLSGRQVFGVMLAIVVAHLVLMSIYLNGNRLAHKAATRDAVIQKIVNVVNLIYATPVEDRKQAIDAMADPYLNATITTTPAWPLQFKKIAYWQISQALRRQLDLFSVSIQLTNNQWLNINATIYSHYLTTQLIFFSLEVVVFAVILLAIWLVGRFSKPFQNFKRMADRLGADPNSELVPLEDAPSVAREAAEAMHKMQQRIQELIRDRTQMLAAISHDLRTPITRMKLRAQFIQDEAINATILADLDEMDAMITETLAFAREDSASELRKHIDLVSMVSSICDGMVDLGHDVKFTSESQRVALWARPIALKRAFNNIIGNAVRYATSVNVSIQLQHDSVRFVVNDDGPGIPEEELKQVFEPFYRAEHSRSRDTGGVGLGLAVTRDIVKAHTGHIELKNRDSGGLCAIIEFPLESMDAHPAL